MNEPVRDPEIERQIAEYERRLREQLLSEQSFAELASQQHERPSTTRLLPMLGAEPSAGASCGQHVNA